MLGKDKAGLAKEKTTADGSQDEHKRKKQRVGQPSPDEYYLSYERLLGRFSYGKSSRKQENIEVLRGIIESGSLDELIVQGGELLAALGASQFDAIMFDNRDLGADDRSSKFEAHCRVDVFKVKSVLVQAWIMKASGMQPGDEGHKLYIQNHIKTVLGYEESLRGTMLLMNIEDYRSDPDILMQHAKIVRELMLIDERVPGDVIAGRFNKDFERMAKHPAMTECVKTRLYVHKLIGMYDLAEGRYKDAEKKFGAILENPEAVVLDETNIKELEKLKVEANQGHKWTREPLHTLMHAFCKEVGMLNRANSRPCG